MRKGVLGCGKTADSVQPVHLCPLCSYQGPVVQSIVSLTVVQNIVSLTSLLRGQLVKCFVAKYMDIFVEEMREALAMQKILIFFIKKYLHIGILTFEILTKR